MGDDAESQPEPYTPSSIVRMGAMMDIKPSETVLTGQWILQGGRPVADDVCKRILALTSSHLVEVGRDASGWNALYRDPNDGVRRRST
jgi:hypothetical protein